MLQDPRVEQRIDQVDDEVDDDEHAGGQHDDPLHERDVLSEHGLLGEPADAEPGEHGLRDDGVRDRQADQHAEDRERRQAAFLSACLVWIVNRESPLARAVAMYAWSRVSSSPRISTCARMPDVGSDIVSAGSTSDDTPREPVAGNQPSENENSWISSSPTQNVGNDTPTAGSRCRNDRSGRQPTYVARNASPPPMTVVSTSAIAVRAIVGGRFSASSERDRLTT